MTVTVRGMATVLPTPDNGDDSTSRTVTVDLTVVAGAATSTATAAEFGQGGQVNDAGIISRPRVTLTFAENTGTVDRMRTATGSITVRTNQDEDAEDEKVMVMGDVTAPTNATGTAAANATDTFTINDDETQTYVLTLDTSAHTSRTPPKELETIHVRVEAKPGHYQGGATLTLLTSDRDYGASGDDNSGAGVGDNLVYLGTANPAGAAAGRPLR